jgi:D-sedoheptulose 7-phosphate isomerase
LDLERIRDSIAETVRVMERVRAETAPSIQSAGRVLADTLTRGGKILLCGNGGSAADCQHIATELCVRYLAERRALPAIALTTDTSILTAAGNDLGFDRVFSRQVEALGRPGDALVAISTSGDSSNVLRAVDVAKSMGVVTIGLTGEGGGALGRRVDHWVPAPATSTPRIQEAHLVIEHLICEIAEAAVGDSRA